MGLRLQQLGIGCLFFFSASGVAATSWGQLNEQARLEVANRIEATRAGLSAAKLPNLPAIQESIKVATGNVENYFRAITTEEQVAAWMEYLATQRLIDAMNRGDSLEEIVRHAERTRGRLVADHVGLELAPLLELRQQVDRLIAASRFSEGEKSIKFIDQQLTSLEERVRNADAIPTAEQASALSAISRVLYESNQANDIPAAMRSTFSQPNVVISVSGGLIQSAVGQMIDRCRPVNDCILGTRVVGTGHLVGSLSARTVPAYGNAAIEVSLQGQFTNQSKGYNGPVTVDTSGYGNVSSSRMLYLAESGVTLGPTVTHASLATHIDSINHPLRLVRKIASKRAAQQKPQAEAIGREKLRQQVGREFAEQVETAVRVAPKPERQAAIANARNTLVRLDIPEPQRALGSTTAGLFVIATQAGPEQLAAAVPAPALDGGSYDLAIQLHESTVDNIATRVLAGRTMSRDQLDRLITRSGRPAPTSDGDEDEAPFVIDFARLRPIIFEARSQMIRVGLRGTRFKQGDRELKQALEITATYVPVRMADGSMSLERQGDVAVDFPGNRRLSVQQIALRHSIQKLFANRFPPQLLTQALTLPSTLPVETLRGRQLRATGIDSQNGWLSLSAR